MPPMSLAMAQKSNLHHLLVAQAGLVKLRKQNMHPYVQLHLRRPSP